MGYVMNDVSILTSVFFSPNSLVCLTLSTGVRFEIQFDLYKFFICFVEGNKPTNTTTSTTG